MKNLLVWLSPNDPPFFPERDLKYSKMQIENSLDLGWRSEDILIITNFEFEHMGVRAHKIDTDICQWDRKASKVWAICRMFDLGMINDLCFFHDFDAFQQIAFDGIEKMEGADACFTTYGWKKMFNTGVFFFNKNSSDIFYALKDYMLSCEKKRGEEPGLYDLLHQNKELYDGRYRVLNQTYNFGKRRIKQMYDASDKPLKIVHFNPVNPPRYNEFILGKNESGHVLVDSRLRTIIEKYL